MQRLILLILLTILCHEYSTAQFNKQIDLPDNWSTLNQQQQLQEALTVTAQLGNRIIRKQFIDNFTNTLKNKSLLAEAFTSFGEQAESRSNFSEAENLYFQALSVKRNIGDTEEIGRGLFRVGYVLLLQSKYKESIEYFSESEAIFKENESYYRLTTVYNTKGEAYHKMGAYEEGLKQTRAGLDLSKSQNDKYGEASALLNMSEVYISMKSYDQAISKARESILIFEELYAAVQEENDKVYCSENAAVANMNIGSAYFYKDDNSKALKYYRRALNYQKISASTKAKILNNINTISLGNEKYEDALNIYRDILQNDTPVEDKTMLAYINLNLGNLYYQEEQYAESRKHLEKVEEIARDNNDLDLKGEVTQLLAYNYHFLGQSDKSLEYSDEWRKAEKKKTQEAIDAKNYELVLAFNDRVVAESKRVEAENDKLTAEQKQQLYLILFLFATILGLLAAFYAYRQKGRRKRAEKEKQQKIESILKENEIKTIRARLNGIDEERARISEDLHDGIGIMLTGTQLHFEALGERLDNMEASNKEQFDAAFKLLTQTQQQTRRVIHDMANQTLLNYGLIAQVNELLSMLKKASDVNINFSTQGIPDPNQWSSAFEMKIYKVIQELINNALKNANADNLDIQIQQIENELSLSVKDDGEGFDVNESYEGMGMRTVENRVKDLGGVLSINSVKGKGTNILIKNIHLN